MHPEHLSSHGRRLAARWRMCSSATSIRRATAHASNLFPRARGLPGPARDRAHLVAARLPLTLPNKDNEARATIEALLRCVASSHACIPVSLQVGFTPEQYPGVKEGGLTSVTVATYTERLQVGYHSTAQHSTA